VCLQTGLQKNLKKHTSNQPQEMSAELVEIVSVWHDFPSHIHIMAAAKALTQTTIQRE